MAASFDGERIECVGLGGNGFLARSGVRDELGEHGIIVERNFAPLVDAGIDAHSYSPSAALGRRPVMHQAPNRGQEIAQRILGVDPRLHRPPGELDVTLLELELFAGGDADHLLDQVDAGDELGDGMLDLQARIHLEEIEAPVLSDDELHRARRIVGDRLGERDRLLTHLSARGRIDERAWRFLHDLLIAALDRAFALAEMNDIAVLVAEHLDFDVARVDDEFLDEHLLVAEGRFRLRASARKSLSYLGLRTRNSHAFSAAARGGLDHHGVANFVCDPRRLLGVGDRAEVTWNDG